jgi:hypothetical protein
LILNHYHIWLGKSYLRVIVLQADLKLNGLKEVSLLGLVGVLKELSALSSDISYIAVSIPLGLIVGKRMRTEVISSFQVVYRTDCDLRHFGSLPIDRRII